MPSASPGPRDWLDYQQYADTLWMRVTQAFARDGARRAAGASSGTDPLVVGVYGEWGVGKSRLLELMYALAAEQSARECALRALDPHAWRSGRVLRLTVPVWFHPWKYEHEPHLSVPLLMHVTDAVGVALSDAASLREQVDAAIRAQGAALGKTGREIGAAIKRSGDRLVGAAEIAHKIAGNELVRATTGLVAGYFGFGAAAERSLEFISETSARIAGLKDITGDAKGDKAPATAPAPGGAQGAGQAADPLPKVTADGRYYYNVQNYLRKLGQITPETARAHGVQLDVEVHLNFVVFVDDLDRCLPEKAVEVLEVIKTILNIECFAFVIALDDEVIERGISHRYRDYRFKGAKPEMPITGFEYLEKIVHLPFRLPQLSRRQARQFMADMEAMLLEDDGGPPTATPPQRLWFQPRQVEGIDPVTGQPTVTATMQGATALVDLVLNSFETYVPRKLARTMELVHQVRQVLARRGIALQPPAGTTLAPVDARLVVFSAVLQLFAPDLFRLLRRRPAAFSQWMRAYVAENTSQRPVFEWRAPSGNDPLAMELADTDLYRWAAGGSQVARPVQTGAPAPGSAVLDAPIDGSREAWSTFLARQDRTQTERHTIEQLRLPLVESLREFRDARRHAFAPLSLGAALAHATQWSYTGVVRLDGYLQLFVDPPELSGPAGAASGAAGIPVPAGAPGVAGAAPTTVGAGTDPRPVHAVDPRELLELVQSPDAATRASLVERLALRPPERIDKAAVVALANALAHAPAGQERSYLDALAQLAPHLADDDLRGLDWARLPPWPLPGDAGPATPADTLGLALGEAVARAELRRHGLAEALGQTGAANQAMNWMWRIVSGPLGELALRAEAGDLLGALGDPRLNSRGLRMPTMRGELAAAPGGMRRVTTEAEEPVFGFVRVPAGPFSMGSAVVPGSPPHPATIGAEFYIARYLVTVDQYADFVAQGYAQADLWGRQGLAWLNATLAAEPAEGGLADPRTRRPAESRRAPWEWEQQRRFGNRPAVNVTWFEARAFVRWLEPRLQREAGMRWPSGCQLRLPTEPQWERAARAASPDQADGRLWPFGDDPRLAPAAANLAPAGLGRACSVGLFAPNPIGLCDLSGNVWEWTDNLHSDAPAFARLPKGAELRMGPPAEGPAVRGGSFRSTLDEARVAHRGALRADDHTSAVGIRLVLSRD